MKIIILAGGSGSRLWPLSREYFPKYLLSLYTEDTLFQTTIKRFQSLNAKYIIVTNNVINDNYLFSELSNYKSVDISIIKEPEAKNTAAAIALALLSNDDKNEDELYLVTPSGHIITKQDELVNNINSVREVAENGFIVTFGITPKFPDTSLGYIKHSEEKIQDNVYKVECFKEKPDYISAQEYLEDGTYFWNSGMFMFKKSVMLKALNQYCPKIVTDIKKFLNIKDKNTAYNIYSKIENISIDYSVMEKSTNIVMLLSDIGWNDIGSWKALYDLKRKDKNKNVFEGNIFSSDSSNNYIYSKDRLIAISGIKNIIAIDTKDALLICDMEKTQEVKSFYNLLKQRNLPEYQYHVIVDKPWGRYTVLEDGNNFKVKRLTVKPQQKLSLQLHNFRHEHWVCVKGRAFVINEDREYYLNENESTFIPIKSKHRLINDTDEIVEIIETQYGEYLGEDDIVRLEDIYSRI